MSVTKFLGQTAILVPEILVLYKIFFWKSYFAFMFLITAAHFFLFPTHILECILSIAFNRRILGEGCWVCTLYILDKKQVVKQQHDVLCLSNM